MIPSTLCTLTFSRYLSLTVSWSTSRSLPRKEMCICHITPLLQQRHWLPIRQCIDYKIILNTFKVPSECFIDLIYVLPPSRYDLRLRTKGILLSTPKCFTKVTKGDRSFMVAFLRLWNSLPIDIRSACSTSLLIEYSVFTNSPLKRELVELVCVFFNPTVHIYRFEILTICF